VVHASILLLLHPSSHVCGLHSISRLASSLPLSLFPLVSSPHHLAECFQRHHPDGMLWLMPLHGIKAWFGILHEATRSWHWLAWPVHVSQPD
jgi:hypothetical protein